MLDTRVLLKVLAQELSRVFEVELNLPKLDQSVRGVSQSTKSFGIVVTRVLYSGTRE